MATRFARVRLNWLTSQEGGRTLPFAGPRYAPTARFSGEGDSEIFSVILRFDDSDCPEPTNASLQLLNPEMADVQARIDAGARLDIMEGPRKVAECHVVKAESVLPEPAAR